MRALRVMTFACLLTAGAFSARLVAASKVAPISVAVTGLSCTTLSGTDTFDAAAIYGATFVSVGLAAIYRYWIVRSGRPTFATSLPQEGHR